MDYQAEKTLPKGTWMFFNQLPSYATEQDVRTFFYEVGLDIPLECISVRNFGSNGSNAKISISNEMTLLLVNWAINGAKMQGHDVVAVIESRKFRKQEFKQP
jgi:hypothetical protein